jgi:hypothetical protein
VTASLGRGKIALWARKMEDKDEMKDRMNLGRVRDFWLPSHAQGVTVSLAKRSSLFHLSLTLSAMKKHCLGRQGGAR